MPRSKRTLPHIPIDPLPLDLEPKIPLRVIQHKLKHHRQEIGKHAPRQIAAGPQLDIRALPGPPVRIPGPDDVRPRQPVGYQLGTRVPAHLVVGAFQGLVHPVFDPVGDVARVVDPEDDVRVGDVEVEGRFGG